ncbi:MAG: class I SAM-dependent methyltransferase [Clostridia bacterium]|nr:class I SAM-dependent methyltransferase [Clostridia bacterium]
MYYSDKWQDYRLIDCGGGRRLESWNGHSLVRPDPQAMLKESGSPLWNKAHAVYHRSNEGGGSWEVRDLPASWTINYRDLTFAIKPMSFKHTGIFPEQAANWDFVTDKIKKRGKAEVLNLFAYTGAATMACAKAGASVCHVDAARGMVTWAKENAALCGLENAPIRYIVDDCRKFIRREINRGRKYDGIIMDPPSYGRGPSGEIWRFEEGIGELISLCAQLLSDDPLFFVISSYTAGVSPSVPAYILGRELVPRFGGRVEANELGLKVESSGLMLPCGAATRWEK